MKRKYTQTFITETILPPLPSTPPTNKKQSLSSSRNNNNNSNNNSSNSPPLIKLFKSDIELFKVCRRGLSTELLIHILEFVYCPLITIDCPIYSSINHHHYHHDKQSSCHDSEELLFVMPSHLIRQMYGRLRTDPYRRHFLLTNQFSLLFYAPPPLPLPLPPSISSSKKNESEHDDDDDTKSVKMKFMLPTLPLHTEKIQINVTQLYVQPSSHTNNNNNTSNNNSNNSNSTLLSSLLRLSPQTLDAFYELIAMRYNHNNNNNNNSHGQQQQQYVVHDANDVIPLFQSHIPNRYQNMSHLKRIEWKERNRTTILTNNHSMIVMNRKNSNSSNSEIQGGGAGGGGVMLNPAMGTSSQLYGLQVQLIDSVIYYSLLRWSQLHSVPFYQSKLSSVVQCSSFDVFSPPHLVSSSSSSSSIITSNSHSSSGSSSVIHNYNGISFLFPISNHSHNNNEKMMMTSDEKMNNEGTMFEYVMRSFPQLTQYDGNVIENDDEFDLTFLTRQYNLHHQQQLSLLTDHDDTPHAKKGQTGYCGIRGEKLERIRLIFPRLHPPSTIITPLFLQQQQQNVYSREKEWYVNQLMQRLLFGDSSGDDRTGCPRRLKQFTVLLSASLLNENKNDDDDDFENEEMMSSSTSALDNFQVLTPFSLPNMTRQQLRRQRQLNYYNSSSSDGKNSKMMIHDLIKFHVPCQNMRQLLMLHARELDIGYGHYTFSLSDLQYGLTHNTLIRKLKIAFNGSMGKTNNTSSSAVVSEPKPSLARTGSSGGGGLFAMIDNPVQLRSPTSRSPTTGGGSSSIFGSLSTTSGDQQSLHDIFNSCPMLTHLELYMANQAISSEKFYDSLSRCIHLQHLVINVSYMSQLTSVLQGSTFRHVKVFCHFAYPLSKLQNKLQVIATGLQCMNRLELIQCATKDERDIWGQQHYQLGDIRVSFTTASRLLDHSE